MPNQPVAVSIAILILASVSHAQQHADADARQSEPTRVRRSESVTRQISGAQTHEFRIALHARQALHVIVNQLGVDVVVAVAAPNGESVVEMDSPNGANGPESVWVIASMTGDYRFRVHPFDQAASGRYEFRVDTIRNATADDQTRVRMQRSVANGTRLLEQEGRDNRIAGARELKEAFAAALQIKDTTTTSIVGSNLVRLDPKAALEMVGVSSAPGPIPLYFSRGYDQRGRELRERLTRAVRFFETRLEVTPNVMLAVLSQNDWTPLSWVPSYDIPWSVVPSSSVAPDRAALVAMPATRDLTSQIAGMSQPGGLSRDELKTLDGTGLTLEEGVRLATDGIMYHELGHIYADAVGLPPRLGWLGEFFADFLWVAYFTDGSPDPRAVAYTNAWRTWRLSARPAYTSLEDFDRLYFRVGNYGWYQAQFEVRAAEVYKSQGFAFLQRARAALPPTDQPIAVDEALRRLEQVSPGFVEWAARLAAMKQ